MDDFKREGVESFVFSASYDEKTNTSWFQSYGYNYGYNYSHAYDN